MKQEPIITGLSKMTDLLAEIGILLISNGANSGRTARNLTRISESFGYTIEQFFSHSAIVITVQNKEGNKNTVVKKIGHYGVNYSIVSDISILSWKIAYKQVAFEDIEEEIKQIQSQKPFSEWIKVLGIGFATASLSKIFDGDWMQFFVAFLAAIAGMLARMPILKKKYNVFISWLIAAFVSTSVVNIFRYFGLDEHHAALSACVLWLIPGVPLINGFLDILEGHIVSGWAKAAMGTILVFMIAVGFYLSLILFGYGFAG